MGRPPLIPNVASRHLLILLGIIAVGFALRLLWIGAAPLHPDEYHYAYNMMAAEETASLSALRDLDTRFLVERRTAHPLAWTFMTRWLWFLPLGWAVPWSPGFLRLPNVVAGTLLIPMAWAILRVCGDKKQALTAALFVAMCPGLVWISRTLYQDTAFTLWLAMMLLGGVWALKTHDRSPAILVGIGMGLCLATKISAPILTPVFLVLALAGPRGIPMRRRVERLVIASALALGLFLFFCDPAAYLNAIRQPSDPRYQGSISLAHMERTFIGDLDVLLNIFSLDLPLTLLLCVLAAGLAWREKRPFPPVAFLLALACLSPLLLLHIPPLSGPHGFAPLYFILCLLGAPVIAMKPHAAAITLITLHGLLATVLVVARETGHLDDIARAGVYPPRDALYTPLRDDLHRRHPPRQILVVGDDYHFLAARGIIRLSELTEGAIILGPPDPEQPPTAEAWSLADVVLLQRGHDLHPPEDQPFRRTASRDDFEVWRRVDGTARSRFTRSELSRVGEGEYLLPGNVRIMAGRIATDHIELVEGPLPRTKQENAPVTMDGRVNYIEWGSGRVLIREDAGDVTISIESPRMDDVFWDF